mgnify:FL=1
MRSGCTVQNHILACSLVCILAGWTSVPAWGRYIRPQLDQTPIERLVKNLNEQIKKDPKSVTARFNLARVHAMAFALKTDQAQTMKGKPERGAWFGYEPKHVPFTVTQTKDPQKKKLAEKQLELAIQQYQQVLQLKPNHQSAQLGYAWCLQQSGETEKSIAAYRKTVDLGWKKEKSLLAAGLGWHSLVKEASGYLIPLLDTKQDQAEIAKLEMRVKHVRKIRRPVTPIVIPLKDGMTAVDVSASHTSVLFDADGSGESAYWNWISRDAGWLVYDHQRTGKITSALQLFGNVTFWCFWDHGYQALASLDNDHNGRLAGTELTGLAIWRDINQNGISEPGEVRPLADWKIVSLSCRHEIDGQHPDRIPFSPQGITLEDGRTRPSFDILLRKLPRGENRSSQGDSN